jgi:hypothetical protein
VANSEWKTNQTLFAIRYFAIRASRVSKETYERTKEIKGSGTPEGAGRRRPTDPHHTGAAPHQRAWRAPHSQMLPPDSAAGALAFRRSTAALAKGTVGRPRLSSRPCFLRRGRSVRSCTAAPTGGRRPRASPRALPAASLSQSSEHLAHRSLCRQDDAQSRPSAEVTSPAREHRSRFTGRRHRTASFYGERDGASDNAAVTKVNAFLPQCHSY